VPVLIALDGQNWWQHRPDLWNWWDPNLPGYNPSNIFNVEWTGWSPTQAVKVCWRNWGSQQRVVPAPNIASPTVVAAHLQGLRSLAPIIVEWHGGPREAVPLAAEMKSAGQGRWAAAEWWWGGATAADWEDHFRQTLSFRDCRFICVYNWNLRMFENAASGQEAVRKLVAEWRE